MKNFLNLSTIGVLSFSLCAFGCSSSNSKGGSSSKDAGSADSGSSGSGGGKDAGASGKGGGGSGGKGGGGSGGTSAGSGGSSSSSAPSIKIDSPANNAQITASAAAPDVPVAFTVENFTLKGPGTCAGAKMCGHVHVLVDGSACNDVGSHSPYNAAAAASPTHAGLDYCPHIAGSHKITLELHNDDHSPVKDSNGKTISDSISITVTEEGDAG